jgi:hypothetical protein
MRKPSLTLHAPRRMTFANLLALVERLGGKKPAPEDLARLRRRWRALRARLAEADGTHPRAHPADDL